MTFIVIVFACLCTPAMAQTKTSDSLGEWAVVESACSGCPGGFDSEQDVKITIAPNHVSNPFAADCSGTVDLTVVRQEKLRDVFRTLGLPARWKPKSVSATSQINHLVVGCDQGINGRFYQLTPDEMLMPYEADTTFLLKRVK